jgi:hypothetical protein
MSLILSGRKKERQSELATKVKGTKTTSSNDDADEIHFHGQMQRKAAN